MIEKGEFIFAIIASAAAGHILFLAAYLSVQAARHLPNKILSVLLFCYSLRIIKSVLLLALPGSPFAHVLIALGVIGMSAIGPLLLLYVQALLKENFVLTPKHYLHFIPTLLLWPVAFFIKGVLMFQVYQFTVYQILVYTCVAFVFVKRTAEKGESTPAFAWLKEVFAATTLLWTIFMIQLDAKNEVLYTSVSLLAAAVFYAISLRAAFRRDVFYPMVKRKRKANGTGDQLLPVIEAKLKEEKLYLDSLLTVNKLAYAVKLPAYQVSAAINEEAKMGFPEFLNQLRVQDAQVKLTAKEYKHLSIEAIAYDSGFNSLSAFYNAFKKINGITPAKFRQQFLPDSEIRKPVLKTGK